MVRTQIRVIYGDTDQMGVVYYANYLRFFEAGRNEFIRASRASLSRLRGPVRPGAAGGGGRGEVRRGGALRRPGLRGDHALRGAQGVGPVHLPAAAGRRAAGHRVHAARLRGSRGPDPAVAAGAGPVPAGSGRTSPPGKGADHGPQPGAGDGPGDRGGGAGLGPAHGPGEIRDAADQAAIDAMRQRAGGRAGARRDRHVRGGGRRRPPSGWASGSASAGTATRSWRSRSTRWRGATPAPRAAPTPSAPSP